MFYFGQTVAGILKSVESKSVDIPSKDFKKIDKAEYDAFIAALPPAPAPIDLKAAYAAAADKTKFMAELMGLL